MHVHSQLLLKLPNWNVNGSKQLCGIGLYLLNGAVGKAVIFQVFAPVYPNHLGHLFYAKVHLYVQNGSYDRFWK